MSKPQFIEASLPYMDTDIRTASVGGIFTGRLSDRMVKKWLKRRGGEWVPEDRLRAAIFSSAFLVPVSVLCSGIATHFVGGIPGLVLNLVCLFFNGLSVSKIISELYCSIHELTRSSTSCLDILMLVDSCLIDGIRLLNRHFTLKKRGSSSCI